MFHTAFQMLEVEHVGRKNLSSLPLQKRYFWRYYQVWPYQGGDRDREIIYGLGLDSIVQ